MVYRKVINSVHSFPQLDKQKALALRSSTSTSPEKAKDKTPVITATASGGFVENSSHG